MKYGALKLVTLSDLYIFKNGMRKLTFPQKENTIFYLKKVSILKNI